MTAAIIIWSQIWSQISKCAWETSSKTSFEAREGRYVCLTDSLVQFFFNCWNFTIKLILGPWSFYLQDLVLRLLYVKHSSNPGGHVSWAQQPYVVSSSSNGQHGCHSKAWLGVTEWPLVCSDVIQLKEEAWQTYWEWEQDVQWRNLDAKETQEMRLNPEQGTDQNRGSRNPAELEFATDMSLWK